MDRDYIKNKDLYKDKKRTKYKIADNNHNTKNDAKIFTIIVLILIVSYIMIGQSKKEKVKYITVEKQQTVKKPKIEIEIK